jgi:hypothetical protein
VVETEPRIVLAGVVSDPLAVGMHVRSFRMARFICEGTIRHHGVTLAVNRGRPVSRGMPDGLMTAMFVGPNRAEGQQRKRQ